MIIYYAGIVGDVSAFDTITANGCKHLLLSYYYRYKNPPKAIARFRRAGVHLFLDSGAFSAWKKGVTIDLQEYERYIQENHFGKYVVLDVIGDPEESHHNLKRMEADGFAPVPVFHLGSDQRFLHQLVDEGYKHICLGGTVGASMTTRLRFFEECFGEFPEVNFHGLGLTDTRLLLAFPWFSVDSTTWLVGRKYGEMLSLEDGQRRIKLPKEMPIQLRHALNVRVLSEIEKFTERGII